MYFTGRIRISYPGPGGFYYVLGENAYYSFDLSNWVKIDLTGLTGGEITSAAFTDKYMYVGTQSGGVFRQDLNLITSLEKETNNIGPQNFELMQNYPNPFNPVTTISYHLPKASPVTLLIFDNIGRLVASQSWQKSSAGTYHFSFDASMLVSGTYYYQLQTDFGSQVKRMTLIK
jgi:type IX secretion system substrate protein